MMTDPNYAEKMASVVDNTRKVNTGLMNKSEEYESSLSLNQPKQQPLDLARIGEMKAEDAARATMPSEDDNYSGVSDLATKVYAEERSKRIGKALQHDNTYFGAPHGMRLSQAASDIYDVEKAKDVQGIYDKVLQDESVSQAIQANANKALLKAMEANKSMSEDEQKKVYDDAVSKQLEAIGKGIDKYLYDINAPKSEAEWVAKNAVNSSIMGQMLTSPMNVEGGENTYRQQALADYGAKASWLSQGISMAGSLIIDTLPMMGIGTAFAAPASKAAMWGVGKVGGKALQGSLIGRGVVGSVGGAATLGGYNAASALTTQFSNGQFDLGEITSSAGYGALMGGLTGVMSPVLRGVSQGMGKVGKAATMAGGLGAEAGIFSAAELAEMENPYDFETIAKTVGKNVVVIGGLKLSNPIKTIGEYKRWYNEGKQSNFDDADYKMMADFAKANGFANSEAFSMSADGVYSRSIADRVTGNRTLLELTKLEGGKERNLAIEMYNDPNVPISLKTKIAAKMNLPAPKPLLANGVRVEGNKAITYCTMPNGAQQVIEIKEFARPRNARAFANEFSRTTARKNDLMQTEAAVNNISTEPIVIARLNEQAKRNGTTYEEELARLNAITQKAIDGTITAEDVAYYSSIVDTDISATEAIKQGIKDEYGVEIDDVLKSDGNLTDVQDKALTAYADALRGIVEQGNPTTERMLVASTSGVADYVALNRLGIEQTRQIMENPAQRAEIDAQMRSKYGAWLKYFDGKMGEDALAAKLGYDLNNSTDLQNFLAEQTYFKNKAADRIAANTIDVAKQLLEQGGRGVRFTEGGKVKLQGVPYPIVVGQEIVDRYDAAMQGSGEPMSRIVNDALKDIIKQSETPSVKEPIMEEMPDATEQPMTDADAVTQQMVDGRLAEIDTDLQGIEADGVQRMTINGRPVAIIKGRIVADADGKVDKTKSSTEVAYMLLDENGRPILEDGKPKIEVGVKPSNVRVEDIEQWRSVDDYKASEEQRIRENNRLTDEAMQMADEEMHTEEMPAESKVEEITDPQTTDELLTLCKGDRELALDVAMDELNRAQQSKGKGANAAETMAINQRIRTYQRIVDDLSKVEEPTPTEAPTEQNADAQVTDDMEFIYQKDLGENHDGMEPMQLADGRYKWIGLQRGELTATMGERDAELLDGLAKKLGVAVIPIDVADSAVNGYYRDGNVYVNTNRGAEWTMRWVAGHEMLHDVAKKSPEAYDAYKQAVLNMWDSSYIDSQVKQIIDDYAASGKTIDREQALTELVNDFGGELFNSRDGLNILDNILKGESRKGNTGFVGTIKQWWERLKEWFSGTPYYNEAQKMLEQAYKDAVENVDYQAREEQLSKDMDDAFFGETDVVKPKEAEAELKETKDFTPTKMPSGTTIEDKPSGDFSVKSIMRGVGIDAQTDGDNVWFEKDGKRYSKDVPMTIAESESGILKDMVDQCVELGLMDEAKSKDVYKMYTGIVNKIIEKADGSFADLNNQYLWLGETVYRVVHSNSDKQYKRSLDVTLVCKKNEAVIRGISELQRRQGFGVTPAQIMQLYYSTLEKGYQVPCPVCYVFSRYIQNGQYTSNLMYGHSLYDNNPYFRNPAEMTPEQKAAAEAYWLKEYKRVLKDEEKNKKLIDACKSVMSWATKEMDKLMLEAATGSNKADKRKEYEKRAAKLDEYYRAAINLVSKADMSGYITSVITKPIVKDKKVVGMEMREDAGQKLTPEVEEAILDFRKVALAKTKYPHIARYIASKGSAAGKGYNFESDNPMGDILQQLSTDAKNNYQEAMNATTEKERAKLLNEAKKKTMNSARYAARQTLRGGIRQWSWSDNIEALAPDVALNAMQVGMLGGAMQTYSKQLEGIEMMAAMNAYVNGSLMGHGMGYQKVSADFNDAPKWQDPKTGDWYSLHFDDVVGVQPYNRNGKLGLFALNEMYDRAGNILVGMNDIHIRTAMADPRIFFIIPWHASGMSDHILKQMNSMLKLDMAGFKASDYTKHQEEKMYENKLKKQKDENGVEIEVEEIEKIPESTTRLWQSHDYSEKFLNRDGTQAKIELADGQLSVDQLHYRELRDAVLTHSTAESAGEKDKAFWAEHQDWLTEIKNDIFLNQVLESIANGPGKFGIAMTTEDCGFVYPYEYWDKASTYNGADVNGQRYVEYCRRLGVKPKFSGIDGKAGAYGNFVDDSGYWKLLIDRRMYDREGNYQGLTPVDISGFKADFIDQDKTAARFPVTVVADKKATSDIVDDVQYNELKVYNDNPLEVDYEQTIKEALKEAKKAEEKYIKAKQAVQITKTGKQKVVNQSELYKLELDRLAKKEALADIENDNFLADEGAEMSIVRDRNKVEELENEGLVPMFRTFQILDGALYSPMATVQRGEKVHSVTEGDWWKSDENPDLAKVRVKGSSTEFYDKDDDRISKKDGQWVITIDGEDKPLSANGNALSYYFLLKKGEKGDVVDDELYAAYNPYIHASRSSLNDQFKGAYLRPNLVLVEVLVPKSEIDGTNRYKADYAKDGIGEVDWNSGSVIKQAVAAGHPGRKVALSRYAKIGKVFTNAEWAKKIDEELSAYKEQITLPFVAFPPEVLRELANMGYKVEPPTSKKAQPYYEAWLNGEEPTDPNGGGEYSIKSDKQKQFEIISSTNPMRDDYHTGIRKVDDILTLQEAIDASKQENGEDVISTYPDVDESVYNEALQSGKIKVYSSKPIANGAFVGPSMMQAKDYAGGGKVYSKEVNVGDIAWINADEGVYANLGKRADESVIDYAKRMSRESADADYTTYFSVKANNELDKKSLVGIHNLTEDNLRYALNLGGLANPSTAVINKDIMGLEGFGDISLIMPKSLVAKSSGKNAGTFAGDAYTPRFPRGSIVKYMTRDGEKAVAKDYPGKDKFSQDFRSAIYSLGDEYGGVTPTLYYMYKLENGGADIVKTKAPEFKSDKHRRMVEKFGQKEWYELSDAEKQELFEYRKTEMQEMLKNADKGLVSKRMSNFANYPVDDVAHNKLRTLQAEYKKLQNAGEIDYAATYRNAQDDVALAGEQADFDKWLSQISAKYGIEDRIFRGYTPSGNRKYAPLTLANLSKIMKEQGRAGEESFMSKSVYSLRAKMLPAFKTLESIRKNKDKITDEETYNKRREEISSEYYDLISALSMLPNVTYDDAHYVLEDALTKGFAYAEKTANTKFDDAVKARIEAFGKLLSEAPSKYFETKFERPVMFNEFVAAIVPKDINPELRKALADNGLAVEEYDRGDEASRLEAIRKASDRNDVQFSIKGGKNLEDRLESKYTQTRLRAARELAGDDESALMILDDLEPQTLEEYVAEQLGANGRKLLWENGKFSKGLKAHLGVSENEKKTYRSIISKDGYPPEVLAEEIWKSMPEEFYERYTDQDVFNTILDLASSYTRKQLKDFVVNRRIDAVIEFARKQEEWDAAQEEMYLETLSEQERNAYLANKEEMERVDKMSKKERAEYYKQKQVEQMLGEMTPEERAEYEAKEQWRKENAAAITSSFFAERRLDKADKIQKLKDEINKLIKETRATNKENSEKVKEIAKEMQAYIKENIPTETQGDMTRPQFEQVIKQLSTAITRKDLEKPMRMVEYIGANANRRALTRQMRDFLKQGFKGMTPKGLVKAKNVDGATSRVLGLAKSLYESMGKQPLGSDLRALQTKVRGVKAELEDFNNANGGAFSEYVEQINSILKKSGVDRYEEMTKYYNELSDRQDVGEIQVSEVLDHINRMLPELFSIELVKEQRTQAKADSAMTTKEDLEQLRNNLEDKREKGILGEEDQAVLDNMAMYELMVNLQQRQLDIDGPGTSSIASQMAAKVREAKQYRDELEKYDDKQSGVAKNLKDNIKRVNAEMEELFIQRTQAQKEVNANVAELLDNLKQLRDTGNSNLKEWSKNKQERETRIVAMANASFGKDARGYWSEVDRRGGWKRDFSNRINNLRLAALMSPALSFEYMVGVMDPRYYTNESPIYKQFIKGEDGLIKANDNFFEGLEAYNNGINEAVERFINRNAMQSLKEYFNRGDRFATEIIPFEFEVKENVNGEVVTSIVHRDAEMTRGRAAKIYAWSRMADGMAKLKAHGVTDETLEIVKAFIGQDYMDFIDWVEDEYFPKLRREKYNPIYKKMYGISMAENEHYFPFETYKKDIRTEKELEQINSDNLGGGIVGNIIERKRNNARLDFTDESPDIFDAISEYGRKMEEWAAYAQVREDLKKVINNKQFKQHCDELGTHYYKYFLEAAQVASRLSRDMAMTQHTQSGWAKLQKTFASAAISLRVSTALKQLLSAPAFMVYSLDPAFHHELIKTVQPIDVESAIKGLRKLAEGNMGEAKKLLLSENWVGHYNWCVENLPSFRERVTLKGAGNPILEEKGFAKFADGVQSVGMLPNRLVDAFTCSVGAKAIYEYAYKKYRKNYNEKTAHNMAVTDAEIAFNSSQQSSNPVFLAPMQVSKQFLLRGMMNYKNSPIGYYRNAMKASIDMYRAAKAIFGQPKFAINGEVYGFESNGKNPYAMAAESGARASMFWLFLNLIWNFGTVGVAGLSYTMLNGSKNDDGNMLYTDEEIKKALGDDMGWTLFNAATQGIPWVSGFASAAQSGQDYTPSILFSEMNSYVEQMNKDGFMSMATAQMFTDLLLKNAVGVDPEVWGQIYRGAQGIMEDRPMRIEDFMNLIASPRSAIAGVAKQKVGEYDNMKDYVEARIESEREIGINETMDLGKKLTGLRPLRKSKLDGYIDEYLADKIPDYRELANKPDEKAKEERMEESNAFKNLNTLVSTIQYTEEKKKSSKKIDGNEETKDKVKKIRKAVNVIHKLYASGDASSAQRIADELERRLKRGYNENGATLDDKLKNVDIYDSTGTTEQRGTDGFDTMFDRAMLGGFDGVYLGSKLD